MIAKSFGVIRNRWEQCDIEQQIALLDRYLDPHSPRAESHWLEFLAKEFGLLQSASSPEDQVEEDSIK